MTRKAFLGKLLRGPRQVLILFLVLTLLPAIALVWLGLNQLKEDRTAEQARIARIREQRNQAAELIVSALQQTLNVEKQHLENRLEDPSGWSRPTGSDGHIVRLNSGHVEVFPQTSLLYYPVAPNLPEAPEELFQAGEDDEFRLQNYSAAITKFRELTHSNDAATRAAAKLRLARNLRKAGQSTAALDVYRDLANETGVAIAGIPDTPADLVARASRCALFAELHRTTELQQEAGQLLLDLKNTRWTLNRDTYISYSTEIAGWLDTPQQPASEAEVLSEAVNRISKIGEWQDFISVGNSAVIRLQSADGMVAFVAGPNDVRRWLSYLDSLFQSQGVRVSFINSDENLAFGSPAEPQHSLKKKASDSQLPWTLLVSSANPDDDLASLTARSHLWIWGLMLLLGVVSAGSYFVARSIARELATARLQSDFVSSVSHEFRTPLTSLRQVTEILNDDRIADPAWVREYHQTQARATDRLQRLVESLLDFGRMEAGTKPYRLQRFEASSLVQSVVSEFQNSANANGYRIAFHPDGEAIPIDADPEAFTHALWNLLDNAVKYSPDCQTVHVDVAKHGSRIAIAIRDQGIGIPRSEQRTIFLRFVRGAASKTNGIKGTGVGLAIVEHIVRAHDGEIQLDSEPGRGSTFTILLPQSRS